MLFTTTETLNKAFAEALKYKNELQPEQRAQFEQALTSPSVPLPVVAHLGSFLRRKFPSSNEYWMHTLLKSSQAYFPPKEEKKRSKELEARLTRLKAEHEARQYSKMVEGMSFVKEAERHLDVLDMKSASQQASIGANVGITALTAFVVGWFLGSKAWGATAGLVLGLLLAMGALVGETILFVIRGNKLENQLQIERTKAKKEGTINPFGEAGTPMGKEIVEEQKVIGYDTPQEYVNSRIREESILATSSSASALSSQHEALLKKRK